jgi:hypothetical protein
MITNHYVVRISDVSPQQLHAMNAQLCAHLGIIGRKIIGKEVEKNRKKCKTKKEYREKQK